MEFDEVHEITDKQETRNARDRQAIGKVYERCAAAHGLTVEAVRAAFRKERAQMKEEERIRKSGDAADRNSFIQIANAYGDDSPLGAWAKNMAAQINDEEGEDGDEGEVETAPKAEKVSKVVALHAAS